MHEVTKAELIAMYETTIAAHDAAKASIFERHGDKCDGSLDSPVIVDHPTHSTNLEAMKRVQALPDNGCIFYMATAANEQDMIVVFDPRNDDTIHYVIGFDAATKSSIHIARPRQHDYWFWCWFESRDAAMLFKLSHCGELCRIQCLSKSIPTRCVKAFGNCCSTTLTT